MFKCMFDLLQNFVILSWTISFSWHKSEHAIEFANGISCSNNF
jgi:hypothetical protein